MKPFTGIFLSLLCSAFLTVAQTPVDTAFIYTFGGKGNDICNQIRPAADNGFILIGTTSSFGAGNTSMYAVKTDANCHHLWSKTYGGAQIQAGLAVVPTIDKGFAFLGYTTSFGNGGYDVYLVKTDSIGNLEWQKTYGGPDWDFGYSLKQTHDGGFIICGQTYSYGAGNGDVYLIRTTALGDTLWTHTYGGSGYDTGNSILLQGDSLYTIAGATTSFGKGDTNIYFLQVDTNGLLKNTRTFGCSRNSVAYCIAPEYDRGYLLFGSMDSITPGIRGQVLIKTDYSGNLIWMLPPNASPYQDFGKEVTEAPDHTYLCSSAADGGGYGSSSLLVTHLDSSGAWLAGPSIGGNNNQYGNSVTIGSNRNVLFAGETSSWGMGDFDALVVRFKTDSIVQVYYLAVTSFADTSLPAAGIPTNSLPAPGVRVSPNPLVTETSFLLQTQTPDQYTLSLYDASGASVATPIPFVRTGNGQALIHLQRGALPKGVLLYEIKDAGQTVGSGKLIVE